MQNYLFLLRGGRPLSEKTDAENKAELEAWGAYMGKLNQHGNYLSGQPVVSGGKVISAQGASSEPVVSAHEGIVGGYILIKANDLEQATEIAKECPHIANEGNIEIRELAPMPVM